MFKTNKTHSKEETKLLKMIYNQKNKTKIITYIRSNFSLGSDFSFLEKSRFNTISQRISSNFNNLIFQRLILIGGFEIIEMLHKEYGFLPNKLFIDFGNDDFYKDFYTKEENLRALNCWLNMCNEAIYKQKCEFELSAMSQFRDLIKFKKLFMNPQKYSLLAGDQSDVKKIFNEELEVNKNFEQLLKNLFVSGKMRADFVIIYLSHISTYKSKKEIGDILSKALLKKTIPFFYSDIINNKDNFFIWIFEILTHYDELSYEELINDILINSNQKGQTVFILLKRNASQAIIRHIGETINKDDNPERRDYFFSYFNETTSFNTNEHSEQLDQEEKIKNQKLFDMDNFQFRIFDNGRVALKQNNKISTIYLFDGCFCFEETKERFFIYSEEKRVNIIISKSEFASEKDAVIFKQKICVLLMGENEMQQDISTKSLIIKSHDD